MAPSSRYRAEVTTCGTPGSKNLNIRVSISQPDIQIYLEIIRQKMDKMLTRNSILSECDRWGWACEVDYMLLICRDVCREEGGKFVTIKKGGKSSINRGEGGIECSCKMTKGDISRGGPVQDEDAKSGKTLNQDRK